MYAAYADITGTMPVSILTTSLPNAHVGVAYKQILQASGGTPPYTWSRISGTLPAKLSLVAKTGAISGTPTAPGVFSFTVQAKDTLGSKATQPLSIMVVVDPLIITTSTLAAGTVGTAYSKALAAKGGIKPYAWSLAAGSLPPGLSLDATTGKITGVPMPNTAGTYSFTAQVTDHSQSPPLVATKPLSIKIK